MTDKDESANWDNATWEGARRAQLRRSLQLTPRQRFEALEAMAATGHWLTTAGERLADQLGEKGEKGEIGQKDGVPAAVNDPAPGYLTGNDE